MMAFVGRRVLLGIVVLFGVILVTFVLTRVVPSDPAMQWVGPRATPAQKAAATRELGLDKPLYVQFGKYIVELAHGDLGRSLESHRSVSQELRTYLPATLELVVLSTLLAVLVGLPLGVLSAKRKDRWPDHLSRVFSVGAVSLPTFWVGLFLQLVFYSWLGLLPAGGETSASVGILYHLPHITGSLLFDSLISGDWIVFRDALAHVILPCIALAAFPVGLIARQTRSALLEILNEDYIAAARSYAVPERLVLWSCALKNSLGPTVTVVALAMGWTLVNTFLVEAIFSWPGIGSYVANAVVTLDYPAIMGVTIISAAAYVLLNLVADVVIALDPRVRV